MTYSRHIRRAVVLFLLGAAAGCAKDRDIILSPPSAVDMFTSFVALCNIITAGFQSGGINDSTQRESYAALFAQQVGTRYAYPALASPGCPPPIVDFQTGARVGGAGAGDCALRNPSSVTAALNNVAVPGAASADPTAPTTTSSNALTTFILGGKTQVQRALDANPTFATVWIGNNDVLLAALSGMLTATPGVSPGVTPVGTFTTNLSATVDQLAAAPRLEGGALIGVVQVAGTPLLFPAEVLLTSAEFKTAFDQYTGGSTTVLANCSGSVSQLSFAIVPQIRLYRETGGASGHPPIIGCEPGSVAGTLVGDIFVLDAAEQASLAATINSYNAHISSRADQLGFAYFDPNPLLQAARAGATPCVTTVPNLASATQPFGPCISIDGVHPSGLGHLLLTNGLIAAVNQEYGLSIPSLPMP